MPELVLRLIVLILVSGFIWLLVESGRRFVATRRQRVLSAAPSDSLSDSADRKMYATDTNPSRVRILAFSSPDCRQCHQLQAPALRRVLEARGDAISVLDIDAPTSPELTRRYQVLTVPTTVVLDGTGRAHAVNYGFANTQRLLEQVDEVLAR